MKNSTSSDDGEQTKRKDSAHNRGNCGNGSGYYVNIDIWGNDE